MPLGLVAPEGLEADPSSIEAIAYDGAEQVGTIQLTPAGAVSATGKLSIAKNASPRSATTARP